MTKRDSSIANTTVTKGTDGAEWLRFLQHTGEGSRRPDGLPGQAGEPDRNQGAVSLSAMPAEKPTKRRVATAASTAQSRGAKAGSFSSARRES